MDEERTRDRFTVRTVQVFPVPAQEPFTLWRDLACVVAVERRGTRGKEPYHEQAFYISSQVLPAKQLAAMVRGHWDIENGLHWNKDVVLKEDACTTRAGQAPQNLALLRNLVITLFRLHRCRSITRAFIQWAHDVPVLFQWLRE